MKKTQITSALLLCTIFSSVAFAQQQLHKDQNPEYQISRAKYMGMADSLNQLHSTTVHSTYKAYDWYEAKQERKQLRQQFRRELRMERARSRNFYYPGNYHNGHYFNPGPFNNRRYYPMHRNNFWWWY